MTPNPKKKKKQIKDLTKELKSEEMILKYESMPAGAERLKVLDISTLMNNQSGSRFLQKLLLKANNQLIEFILE